MPTPVASNGTYVNGQWVPGAPAVPPPSLPPPAATGYAPPPSGTPRMTVAPPTAASGGHSTPVGSATGGVALNDPKPGSVNPATGAVTPGGPAPVASPYTPPSPPLLAQPGAYEEWIKAHSSDLNAPLRAEQLYDSGGGSALDNSPLSTVSTTDSSAAYRDWLAQNGKVTGAGNSQGVLNGLSTGPSNSTSVYGTASGQLSGPGATESTYAKNSTAFDSTGAGEDFYAKYGDQQMQNTATENAFGQYGGGFDNTGALENWDAKYGEDPMQKSYTEKLYEGGIGQTDPTYDYAIKKSLEKTRMANSALGEFNSTAASMRDNDIVNNLTGQQASKWVDLAPQADKAKLDRYSQGEKFAGDTQDAYGKRLLNMFDIAGQKDKSTFDRFNQGEKFAGDANDQYRQRILDTFDIAGKNDKATNDRLDTLSTIAGRGDSADTARDNTRVSAASNADRSAADIYGLEQDAQATGANLTRQQGDQSIDLATKQDAANRNNVTTKFGLAADADNSQMSRFGAQAGLAKDLQATGQNRVLGGLNATTDLSSQEAALVNKAYGDFSDVDWTDTQALSALAGRYGVSLEQLESVKGDVKAAVNLVAGVAGIKA